MCLGEAGVRTQNVIDGLSHSEHLENLPDHDACTFENGFAVTDILSGNNILGEIVHTSSVAQGNAKKQYPLSLLRRRLR